MVAAYLEVKDALVNTDARLAGEAASRMADQLGENQQELMTKLKKGAQAIAD